MIKKTIICTLILLLIHIAIRDYIKPDIIISQAEWQNTQISIDNFIYSNKNYENIIVGSSIGRKIITDSLPNFYNLCFEGNAAYSGLDLIRETKTYPKRIFIEINTLYKTDKSNINKNSSLTYPLRQYIPALRDGKQPLPLIEAVIETHITPLFIPFKFSFFSDSVQVNSLDSAKNKIMRQVLAENESNNIKTGKQKTSEEQVLAAKSRLKYYLDDLIDQKVEIYFFIVPAEGVKGISTETYEMIKESFTDLDIYFIPYPPKLEEYRTSDGWHLEEESAIKYTLYFKEQISFFDNNNR